MQLVEYVNSLFEQGLSGEEVIAKTQEWKKKNQSEEEVKTDVVVDQGAAATTTPGAPENLESGSGQLESQETKFFGSGMTPEQMDQARKSQIQYKTFTSIAKPSETYNRKDGYEYKYEITPENKVEYFAKTEGAKDWDKKSGKQLLAVQSVFGHSDYSVEKAKLTEKGITEAQAVLNLGFDPAKEPSTDDLISGIISKDETEAFTLPVEIISETKSKIEKLKKQQEGLSLMDPKSAKIQDEISLLEQSIDPLQTAKIRSQKLANETSLTESQLLEIEKNADNFINKPKQLVKKEKQWNSSTKSYVEVDSVKQNTEVVNAYNKAAEQYAKQSGLDIKEIVLTPEVEETIKGIMKNNYVQEMSKARVDKNIENWIEDNRGIFTPSQLQKQQAVYNKINAIDLSAKQKNSLNIVTDSKSRIDSIRQEKKKLSELDFQTQDEVDEANEVFRLLNAEEAKLLEIYGENFEKSNELLEGKNASLNRLDLLERNYSYTANFLNSIKTAGLDMALGAEELVYRIADAPNAFNFSDDKNFNAYSILGPLASVQMMNYADSREEVIEAVENYKEGVEKGMARPQTLSDLSDGQDWGRYLASTIGSQIPNTVMLVSGGGAALPIMGGVSAGSSFREMQKEMDENPLINYTPGQMYTVAMLNGAVEVLSERVSFGIIGRAQKAYNIDTGIKKGFVNQLKSAFTKEGFKKAAAAVKDVAWESISEGGVEFSSNIFDRTILGKEVDLFEGVTDAMFSGLIMSAGVYKAPNLFKGVVNMVQGPDTNQKLSDNYTKIKEAEAILANNVKMSKTNQAALQNKINKLVQDSSNEINKTLNRFGTMPIETVRELSAIELEQFKVRKQLEGFENDPNMSEDAKKELVKTSRAELQELGNKKQKILEPIIKADAEAATAEQVELNTRKIEAEVETIKKFAGEGKVNVFDTASEFTEATGIKGDVDAFIDPKTNEIFINKEWAAKVGAVTVGSHELLHRILKSTFTADSAAAMKLVEDFKGILSSKELNIVQKRIDENYADASDEVKAEEYLTAFSDAIGKGELKWSDNLSATFMRLARPILNIFKGKGFAEIEFKNGRDVYDFIKDYQSNIKKGEVSERGKKLAAKAESTIAEDIKTSISKGEIASNEVQNIYKEQGVSGAIDIIEKFKPITNRIVEARSQAPNFDRQLLTDEIETGPRGILDLIMEYKPESGVPLAAYINKFLPARAIESSRRVLGEEFTTDVTEAKGVVAEETTEVETKEKPIAKKPTETVEFSQAQIEKIGVKDKAEVETKITEATKESFKGQDIKTFGQTRNVPKAVADVYASVFGLNPQTITDKTRNYQKTDAEGLTTAKQFLLKNANNDFARLPKTKDGFGKGTFLPRNVMNALYTNGKLTGTLKDYMDLIRQKPVKPIYRDAVGQTIRGLLNLHIRNRMFEDLVATTPERLRGGAKFSKTVQQSSVETNINDREFLADYAAYQRGGKLSKAKTDAVEDFIKKLAIQESDKGKSAKQFMKTIKESNDPLIPKEGYYLLSDAKFKQDEKALKSFENLANDLASQIPIPSSIKLKQRNMVLGMFAGHYNIVGSERARVNGPFKTSIIESLKANPESVLSKETIERWKKFPWNNLNSSYASANYTALKKIYASDNIADQKRIAREAFDSKEGKAALEFYDLWNTTLQEWLYSSEPGSKAFENKVNYILKLKKANSAIGTTGERTLAPPGYVYLPGKIVDGTIKFEHLKSSSGQSSESGILVVNGKWSTEGRKTIDAYNGIWGMLTDFNSIDSQTGKVNESGIFRFAESLELAKNIYSVKSDFKTSLYDEIVNKVGKKAVKDFENNQLKISKTNNNSLPNALESKTVKFYDNRKVVEGLNVFDNALNQARRTDAPVKKIRVFDFDDTLARSKSMVIVNMPVTDVDLLDIAARRKFKKQLENLPSREQTFDNLTEEQQAQVLKEVPGATRKINATEFAAQAADLEAQGATFDFTEFSKVVEGKKGPLFSVAQKIAEARGTEDIFILTARPQDAAGPIQEFMKANGIDIPLANITGLGDGTAAAKGRWIAGKAAEGYNDFYFADDAIKNVKAVKDVLSQIDVKSKVQQAKASKRIVFDKVFNDIIEAKTGIESYKQFSAAKAKTVGASKGKFTFFTTPSAEDFLGLLYKTLGKGKVGDAQMAFYKTNLLDPYNRAEIAISQAKVAAGRDYKALKKQFKNIPKTLEKETGIAKYTYQHAIRTYIWNSQGLEVPGLSKRDQKRLTDFVKADLELQAFADQLVNIQKGKPYPKPDKDWTSGNITTDVISGINKVNRAEYLQEWQENVDIIFSEKNINKLEAAFGAKYVEALKDSLRAMKSGSNRPLGGDRVSNGILDWLNNSVGAIMFLNTRSAVLQTISAVNFVNWGDNNILKAGKAFANQKQFWGDFLTLMNSDYLLERRDGLKINVSESEIADAVEGSKNKVNAAISYLLNKGFVFTRYADSFAIASGGATFYRNRIESLVEQGMDRKAAEEQAFNDFRAIAEENQQSSSPSKISQQQRSLIGRIILQFGNTQLQYVRIQKRAVQDLVNKRGDWKSNISKIVYYGAMQNLLFNALQSGLAWALFDDDEDDEELTKKNKEQKLERTINGAIDSQLKGLGIQGAVIAGVKNALITIAEEADKRSPKFEEALDDLLSIAPALGSKIRKLKSAGRTVSWNRKEIKEKGFSMDNPAYLAGAQVISAAFNIPLDRAVMKMNNMRNILNPATENWQKVALALGWSGWDVGLPYFGLAEEKPVLTETEKQTKKLFDLNKSDQVKMLLDLGLTKKQIRALTKEEDRVKEIIKLQNKKKDAGSKK